MTNKIVTTLFLLLAVCFIGCSDANSASGKKASKNLKFDASDDESYCTSMIALLESALARDPICAKKLCDICTLFNFATLSTSQRVGLMGMDADEQFDAAKERIISTLADQRGKDADAIIEAFAKLFRSDVQDEKAKDDLFSLAEFDEQWKQLDASKSEKYRAEANVMIDNLKMDLLKSKVMNDEAVTYDAVFDASSVGAIDRSTLLMFQSVMQSEKPEDLIKARKLAEIHTIVTAVLYPDKKFRSRCVNVYSDDWQSDETHQKVNEFLKKANGKSIDGLISEAVKTPDLFGESFEYFDAVDVESEFMREGMIQGLGQWMEDLMAWRGLRITDIQE